MIRASLPTLVIGAVGSAAAMWAGVPLAPLLGALFIVALAGQSSFSPKVDPRLRRVAHVAIGLVMGSRFPADLAERAVNWPFTLAVIPVFVAICLGLGALYLNRVARYDAKTALFGAMPGGLIVMVALAQETGARTDAVLLGHSFRIIMAVTVIPLSLLEFGTDTTGAAMGGLDAIHIALLAAAGLVGSVAGRAIRFPGADVMGPMALSATLYASGLVEGAAPGLALALALSVTGAALGAQIRDLTWRRVSGVLLHTAAIFAIFTAVAIAVAVTMHEVTGLDRETIFLAFAPGGLTEMAAVSLAMHHDPAFVALHHAVRVTLCAFAGAAIARRLARSPA